MSGSHTVPVINTTVLQVVPQNALLAWRNFSTAVSWSAAERSGVPTRNYAAPDCVSC
jgi:hypothetical protein